MSATAEKWNPETGKWEPVRASLLCESDRKHQYRCDSCHAPSLLAICFEKDNYFFSRAHTTDCPVAKGHKILRITAHTHIDYDAILDYEDRDPPREPTPPPSGANGGGPVPRNPDDPGEDLALDPDATRSIRSASGMYGELIKKRGSDYIDSFAAQAVNSIFLCRDTFQTFKKDWGSPMKLVVTRRCSPPAELKRSGYAILRDAYSDEDYNAIYFMVRMRHPEYDRKFRDRLFGRTKKDESGKEITIVRQDFHRNIAIFASWTKVPHKHYLIYRAELNSRMVAFVNAPDA